MWKWIHTLSCPEIEEYGGRNKLSKYCLRCLRYVLEDSSTDWCKAPYVKRIMKCENKKIRSLQQHCIKQIIENNIEFTQMPDIIRNQIQQVLLRKRKNE